jgi:hypothetical protein
MRAALVSSKVVFPKQMEDRLRSYVSDGYPKPALVPVPVPVVAPTPSPVVLDEDSDLAMPLSVAARMRAVKRRAG